MTHGNLKAGVFTGPQIFKLMRDTFFENSMNQLEKKAWQSFRNIVEYFLGSSRMSDYKDIVQNLLENLKNLGCNMSLQLHFLHSHLDYFAQNLGSVSEEHGERFHQDIREIEKRYEGGWTVNMMADYFWMLKRDSTCVKSCGRRAKWRKFNPS
jgi:hypothetical protein